MLKFRYSIYNICNWKFLQTAANIHSAGMRSCSFVGKLADFLQTLLSSSQYLKTKNLINYPWYFRLLILKSGTEAKINFSPNNIFPLQYCDRLLPQDCFLRNSFCPGPSICESLYVLYFHFCAVWRVVARASNEGYPKVCNHGEGPTRTSWLKALLLWETVGSTPV